MATLLQRIRQKVLQNKYVISSHAIDEMINDEIKPFGVDDVLNCLRVGKIRKKEVDFNGTKYTVSGETLDGWQLEVVIRFRTDKKLLIIANYIVD
ncbi:MAG: DUF4258 domain-containing protein [Acidobacteriota bacterium]|jgi:hypothetical protein|nr:DUF4258 domain-containing protein [Acidobacteriota bacterium]